MRYLRYMALLSILMVPFAYSQAQVRVGIGIGVGPGYADGPPVCTYGYYDYYPYACAPYGYYGPSYFVDGVFIGAGPWYHWGHPAWYWDRGYHRGWYRDRDWDRDHWRGRERWGRDWDDRGWSRHDHERFEHEGRGYGRGYERGEFRGREFRGDRR